MGKIMSLLMVLAMTNYEIVDGTGLTHCALMVVHMTPFKVTHRVHYSEAFHIMAELAVHF